MKQMSPFWSPLATALLFISIFGLAFRKGDGRNVSYQKSDTTKKNTFPNQYLVVLSEDERNQLYNIVRSSAKLSASQAEDYIMWFQKRCNPMDAKEIKVTKKH